MSVRYLLGIVLLAAAGSLGCTGSPSQVDGTVTVTQTTSTTTTTAVPQLGAGAIATSPSGIGLASATLFNFTLGTPPSGGVPPYVVTWNFGDGQAGAGPIAPHAYAAPGTFVATATVTDSKATTVTTSTPITVGTVTGRWTVTFSGIALNPESLDLVQNLGAVTATVNATADGFASGGGAVTNPRGLSVSVTFAAGQPAPYALTYIGTLNDSLLQWSGTVNGFTGCPCAFTATRPSLAFPAFSPVLGSARR
jgi:hypothetical protein